MYKYKDIPDKTKEGLDRELEEGLTIIAIFFHNTLGVPIEVFKEDFLPRLKNKAEQMLFYMNFRNMHPELFKKK
jgi:hypothetical protein